MLSAIEAAANDPVRLVRAMQEAGNEEDAVRRVGAAFGVDDDLARVLLDLQFRSLSSSSRARRGDELRLLRAVWGPPIEATLTVTGRRQGVVSVDGVEHRFRASGRQALDAQIHAFLHGKIARPQLRPVVLTESDAVNGPVRWTVRPDGSGSAEYADDPAIPVPPAGPG